MNAIGGRRQPPKQGKIDDFAPNHGKYSTWGMFPSEPVFSLVPPFGCAGGVGTPKFRRPKAGPPKRVPPEKIASENTDQNVIRILSPTNTLNEAYRNSDKIALRM